jgi:hypothetical protein
MKKTSGTMSSHTLTIGLVLGMLLTAQKSLGAVDSEGAPEDGKVDIVYPAEKTVPYRERRSVVSTVFAISMDQVLPDKFSSKISSNTYNDIFKTAPIPIVQAEIGVKINSVLGGVGATAIYGTGLVDESLGAGQDYSLQLTKKGVGLHFILDNLFVEPYVAPFVEGQYIMFDWLEKQPADLRKSGSTAYNASVRVGVAIQMNWLDRNAALTAQDSSGLENAYLDLFVSQYSASSAAEDPNFQTGMNYGGGIRLEF